MTLKTTSDTFQWKDKEYPELNQKFSRIETLIKKYDLNISEMDFKYLKGLLIFDIDCRNFNKYFAARPSQYDLINLSYILKTAQKHQTGINIKSININHTINNQPIISDLILLIDTMIEYYQDGLFNWKFGWDFKEPIDHEIFANLTEPYTEEEMLSILKYCQEDELTIGAKEQLKTPKEIRRSRSIVKRLRESGCFDNNYKTIKTNEACFIYDLLVIYDFLLEDLSANNQEKYQLIKRYLQVT